MCACLHRLVATERRGESPRIEAIVPWTVSDDEWVAAETRSIAEDNMWVSLLAFSHDGVWNSGATVAAAFDDFSAHGKIVWPTP